MNTNNKAEPRNNDLILIKNIENSYRVCIAGRRGLDQMKMRTAEGRKKREGAIEVPSHFGVSLEESNYLGIMF